MSAILIGGELRAERERQHLDLRAIAARTKIRRKYLEAIEAGDFEKLPGPFFRRSFVRQYAAVLGIDWADIEGDVKEVLEPEAPVSASGQEAAPAGSAKTSMRNGPIPIRFPIPLPIRATRVPAAARVPSAARPADTWVGAIERIALSFVAFLLVMLGCSALYSIWEQSHRAPQTTKPAIINQQPASGVTAPSTARL